MPNKPPWPPCWPRPSPPAPRCLTGSPAFDDGLIHRLTHCTVCHGQPPWTWGILGLWQAAESYVLCERCARTDGLRQVEKLFVRRYVATRGDAS